MPRGPSPNSKSEFIRNQSSNLSAAEIVELAKAAGHEVTPMFVHNIRSRAKVKARVGGAAKSPAVKKSAKKTAKGMGRALSIAKRAAEARAKLAAKGSSAPAPAPGPVPDAAPVKRGPGRPRKDASASVKRGPGRPPKAAALTSIPDSVEQRFAAFVIEIGVNRAEELVKRIRTALQNLSF